jgi:hypothetical protein
VKRWSGRPGFAFVDMSDMYRDEDFYDEVHPKPDFTSNGQGGWSQRYLRCSLQRIGCWFSIWGLPGNPHPMNRSGLRFHHFGLAVPEPGDAFRFLEALAMVSVGPFSIRYTTRCRRSK